MISWLGSGGGWGTREQAIPGEWAMLLLIIVLGALLGLIVLWFALLRHERTVQRRNRRRTGISMIDIGAAADEPEPPAEEPEPQHEPEAEEAPQSEEPADPAGSNGQRKLTDEILSRVEAELAERDTPRWKELAALVHHEFGVSVHPTSIQKAVKKRRLAQAATQTT